MTPNQEMTPHVFLSSKSGKLMCLTVEMPQPDDAYPCTNWAQSECPMRISGFVFCTCKQYEAALQSAMETAVECESKYDILGHLYENDNTVNAPMGFGWWFQNHLKKDLIIPLSGYRAEFKQKTDSFKTELVAIITPVPSEQSQQREATLHERMMEARKLSLLEVADLLRELDQLKRDNETAKTALQALTVAGEMAVVLRNNLEAELSLLRKENEQFKEFAKRVIHNNDIKNDQRFNP